MTTCTTVRQSSAYSQVRIYGSRAIAHIRPLAFLPCELALKKLATPDEWHEMGHG